MKVIVNASQKGGVGKTTLTINLATAAEEGGHGPAWVYDADPQCSLTDWHRVRIEAGKVGPERIDVPVSGLAKKIREMRYQPGVLLIDTPPAVNQSIGGIVALADVVIMPVRPSLLDIRAIGTTIALFRAHAKPDARMFFVLTQAVARSKAIKPVVAELQQHGTVCTHIVYSRVDFQDSLHGGSSVIELDPWGRSANEIRGVLSVALQTAGLPAEPQVV